MYKENNGPLLRIQRRLNLGICLSNVIQWAHNSFLFLFWSYLKNWVKAQVEDLNDMASCSDVKGSNLAILF